MKLKLKMIYLHHDEEGGEEKKSAPFDTSEQTLNVVVRADEQQKNPQKSRPAQRELERRNGVQKEECHDER